MTDLDSPRVFISYSWSSEEHSEWVADLGERLLSDGIDVVLDQWSLEDGHDLHAFMEQMVTDASIKRVIIVSDSLYAAKADGRRGGVGTETQIISKEVYDSVEQTKFIPLVRERDENGEACLPVFLRNRKYIDYSDADLESDAYEQLIRNIFERPKRRKPVLGRPPSHIFDDSAVAVTSVQKAKRFREVVASGRGKPSIAFEDFCEEFLVNLEELRMTYSHYEQDSWYDRIKDNIANARAHRDVFVDVVRTGAMHLESSDFTPLLIELLERIAPFSERPESVGSFFEVSEDNYKFLCYELYLYVVASLLKSRKFEDVRTLIEHRYIVPRTCGGTDLTIQSFTAFNDYARSLEDVCAKQEGRRRLSVMADLLHERADRKDVRFSDLLQADVLLCLASRGYGWYPRSMVYSRRAGTLEMFMRAATPEGFRPLGIVLGLANPRELLQLVNSEDLQRVWRSDVFFHADLTLEALNYDELNRVWGDSSH